MQFLHAAAAFSLVATVFANSGFVETCPMIQMVDDHNIQASCYGPDGLELTVLDLNQCIANLNGQLVQQENGNFADSCEACAADYDGTMWCSKCGDSHNVGIDLNQVIANYDGHMDCLGHDGTCINGGIENIECP